MRENYPEVNHRFIDEALFAECIDAVNGVEWNPTDHKESDNN